MLRSRSPYAIYLWLAIGLVAVAVTLLVAFRLQAVTTAITLLLVAGASLVRLAWGLHSSQAESTPDPEAGIPDRPTPISDIPPPPEPPAVPSDTGTIPDATRHRLENIIAGTRAGTWEWNQITGEAIVSERWADMLGYTLDEVGPDPNRLWVSLLHPDDLLLANQRLDEHNQGMRPIYEFEGRLRHKAGHWIWQLTRGKLFNRADDGRPQWMSGICLDITEFKQADESLKTSAAQLRDHAAFLTRAGRIAGIGRWHYELATGAVEWSDHTCNIHDVVNGYRPSLAQAIAFFAPEAQPFMERAVAEATRTGKPWDLELPLITAMRRRIWVRCAAEAEYQDGKRVRLVGIFQDITQRRKLEDDIRQRNDLLKNILANIPVGLSVIDSQLNLIAENSQFRSLLDLPDSLFKADPVTFESIVRFNAERGEYGEGDTDAIVQGLIQRARLAAPHRFQRQRGDGKTLEVQGAPMPGGGFVTTYSDITDLTRATQAAQEASRSKSQFVANMSHEIRTPMNAILGMLKLLQQTELDLRQADYAGKAQGAAQSLLGILNDVLDFSKMEAGKMELDPQPFHFERLLRDLAVILSSGAQTKRVEVLFDIDPAVPAELVGDAMRLQQVLINLGGNAVKFTEQGEVLIRVRCLGSEAQTVTLNFAVHDTGIGIAEEHLQHIFDGFAQAEASTTRRFGGTGLGLSICKRLVEMMGGDLRVRSTLGQGSVFDFTITLQKRPSPARPQPTHPHRHILVVDDNPTALEVTRSMATTLGWSVHTASSGADALESLKHAVRTGQPLPDVLVLDWAMPGMDGWETLARARAGACAPPVVVMVTAHGREMLARQPIAQQTWLNAFLVKPITAAMLADAVSDAQSGVANVRSAARRRRTTRRRLDGLRLLLVEDNAINQQVARELLSQEGAQITLADNGEQGVHAVAQADPPFDAVLMDLQMPVMDGLTATRVIRNTPRERHLPIIAMTANALASDREACLQAGMDDHVGKPFDLPHLVDVLLRHIAADEADEASVVPVADAPRASAHIAHWPEGFDSFGALQRMGGNAALYSTTLQAFAAELHTLPKRMQSLAAQADRQELTRLVHTLKGLSATVGALALTDAARGVEQHLKSTPGLSPASAMDAAGFGQALMDTQDALSSWREARSSESAPGNPAEGGQPEPVADARLIEALKRLGDLLAASDLAALTYHQELLAQTSPPLKARMAALDAAIGTLEFGAATKECQQLISALQSTLTEPRS
ncbi:MAG: response regulator [Rhodoferax sp.]